ncbi:TAXI family TRAP transporter solute-binding subunit [Enterobacter roggenkampii]|uniref:TAXI family TRAP transporter solute-binding subunit n=1 Tax=Enterobacter roggenkampii TaxID=1812935 RepID=UPI00210D32DE|nr:TAXI family TRAP transporter solute-binding subunit [Enterobacter roggenkampii]
MSNIDKRAQKELYATVEKRAHKLRGNPIAYQVVTGMCPVNVIEMQAQKVQALLDELEDKDKRLNEILTPNMLLPVIDDMDEDNLRHVIKTVCENYSLLHAKWEAAEKRIAELEAREVVLPSVQDVHPLGPQSAKIFCEFHRSIVNRCADEIRKVGVKVSIKGN